jgi:nucleotidyltransferase/DNA polymerase involved in DNA repair
MLERTLREQAAEIAQKLRREDLMGATIKLKIRWPDFTTPTRQLTLPQPTDEPEVIAEAALRLFHQIWTGEYVPGRRSSGVAWNLGEPVTSLYSPVARDRAFVVTNRYRDFFTRR